MSARSAASVGAIVTATVRRRRVEAGGKRELQVALAHEARGRDALLDARGRDRQLLERRVTARRRTSRSSADR